MNIPTLNPNHTFTDMLISIGFTCIKESIYIVKIPSSPNMYNILMFNANSNVLIELNCLKNTYTTETIDKILEILMDFGDFIIMDDINNMCKSSGITPILHNTWGSIITRITSI